MGASFASLPPESITCTLVASIRVLSMHAKVWKWLLTGAGIIFYDFQPQTSRQVRMCKRVFVAHTLHPVHLQALTQMPQTDACTCLCKQTHVLLFALLSKCVVRCNITCTACTVTVRCCQQNRAVWMEYGKRDPEFRYWP